ncbi:hypothetical protein M5689_022019 [Euphorbia peplus]|nr:hypothetical protein M5689_022019 [Euphorbia peplus]
MKTVSGEIESCTPITISTAASVLSKFVSTETGASQAVNAYLRRATASLDELVRLHSKPDRKKRKNHKLEPSANGQIATGSIGATREPIGVESGIKFVDSGNAGADNERKKIKKEKSGDFDEDSERKKIKRAKSSDFDEERVKKGEVCDEGIVREETEKKKRKKKRKNGDNVGDAEVNGVGIRNGEAEIKREIKEDQKRVDIIDGRDANGEVKKEDRKKRKNREVEEGTRNEVEEGQRSKKKKRRDGGEDHN